MRLFRHRRLSVPIGLSIAAAVGGGLGLATGLPGHAVAATPTPTPFFFTPTPTRTPALDSARAPSPDDLYTYTYSANDCIVEHRTDPINILFIRDGLFDVIKDGLRDHGDWSGDPPFGDPQYFGDMHSPPCHQMDGSKTSSVAGQEAYHARWYTHLNADNDTYRFVADPGYGIIASAAVHFEQRPETAGCDFGLRHAVYGNNHTFPVPHLGPGVLVEGGFNYAREDIRKNWVENGNHTIDYVWNWSNRAERYQCNGEEAHSDGTVYYIGAKH